MAKVYPLGIVGEQHYQKAIKTCHPGERVFICHEPTNPYDDMALKVETGDEQTIGYIPKDCWLRDAIHEEGRGVTATILDIKTAEKGYLGVVLNVTLSDDDLPERQFDAQRIDTGKPPKDAAMRFLKGLFR